ncbi:MAG TPA: SDR family oxidoreductase [Coriobacteriia bacterium]
MKDFAGRHVVITGGSSGIGLACAELFARHGADVTLIARSIARLEAACEAVSTQRRDGTQNVRWVSADVSTADEAARAVREASVDGSAPIDILVNGAGTILPGYFESMPIEYFEECMDSWRACVHMCRAAVPDMIERGSGHIVNVSSMGGFMTFFGYTAYSSAKYAIMGFSEALRSEMKPHGITVTVVCPPDTETPGLAFEKSLRPPETDKVSGNLAAVSPDVIAHALLRAVERRRYLVVPGLVPKLYRVLKSNAHWLFFAIVDSDVKTARKARGV